MDNLETRAPSSAAPQAAPRAAKPPLRAGA